MTVLVLGLVALTGAVVLAAVAVLDGRVRAQRTMARLVTAHATPTAAAAAVREEPGRLQRTLIDLAGRLVRGGSVASRLAVRLDRAGLTRTVEEWLVLTASTVVAAVAVLAVLLGPAAGLLLGVGLGLLGPHLYLEIATSRRRARFSEDLPDALQLVAGGLASGYSLSQALDALVSLGEGPLPVEIGRALAQARLGTSVEDALEGVAQRMEIEDFAWIVMAVRVQREVGGTLSEILLQVAATIRERAWLRRHVTALSAEGRLSGWILGLLPIGLGGYMYLVQPDYIGRLFDTAAGLAMVGVGVVLLGLGALWMRSIVRIELG